MKNFWTAFKWMTLAGLCLTVSAFAQDALREAVDAGDVATAQKMVKNGEIEEIYCGKLSATDVVKVYEKIFKSILPYRATEWLDRNSYMLNMIFYNNSFHQVLR